MTQDDLVEIFEAAIDASQETGGQVARLSLPGINRASIVNAMWRASDDAILFRIESKTKIMIKSRDLPAPWAVACDTERTKTQKQR